MENRENTVPNPFLFLNFETKNVKRSLYSRRFENTDVSRVFRTFVTT